MKEKKKGTEKERGGKGVVNSVVGVNSKMMEVEGN